MKLAVFASGNGSNFEAIVSGVVNGELEAEVVLLVCDREDAFAIKRAEGHGISVFAAVPKSYGSKVDFEKAVLHKLEECGVEIIVLAGYMRLVGDTLLGAYEKRIVNIHPSLLPSFPGLDAIGQAFDAGVKVSGVTVHYVDAGMDTGPIIAQECVKIDDSDTRDDVQRKIQHVEHELYPSTIQNVIQRLKGSV